MARTPSWIMDGNYSRTLARRLACCDRVFFLDYPVEVCLESVRARRGTVRPDPGWRPRRTRSLWSISRRFPSSSGRKSWSCGRSMGRSPGWCSAAGARWTPICGAWMQEWQRQKGSKDKVFAVRPRPSASAVISRGLHPGQFAARGRGGQFAPGLVRAHGGQRTCGGGRLSTALGCVTEKALWPRGTSALPGSAGAEPSASSPDVLSEQDNLPARRAFGGPV